jgi:hypothetical protein
MSGRRVATSYNQGQRQVYDAVCMHFRMPPQEYVGGIADFLTWRGMDIILRDSTE